MEKAPGTPSTSSPVGWTSTCRRRARLRPANAGKLIKQAGLFFDVSHTSVLTRAVRTANLALEASGQVWLPVTRTWRLNERHYGGLQGKDKKQTADQFGPEQVKLWRRSYDVPLPRWAATTNTTRRTTRATACWIRARCPPPSA